jgi:hypothetical protein
MQPENHLALKEWAVVALGAGRWIVLLRSGLALGKKRQYRLQL